MTCSTGIRMAFAVAVFYIALPALVLTAEEYVIVETTTGRVRGITAITLFDENPYASFKGIPYAEPPIGRLRFKVYVYFETNSSPIVMKRFV